MYDNPNNITSDGVFVDAGSYNNGKYYATNVINKISHIRLKRKKIRTHTFVINIRRNFVFYNNIKRMENINAVCEVNLVEKKKKKKKKNINGDTILKYYKDKLS